jgi:general secretion pathway protein J
MELLIAVSLLSLLSVGMLFAIRIGLNAMSRTNDRLMSNRRVMGIERIFGEQIAGLMPVKADCKPGPNAPLSTLVFFSGESDNVRFVSSYSLQEGSRGTPNILEFQVIPGEEGRGVRLIVNETRYTGRASTLGICIAGLPDPTTGGLVPRFRPVEIGPQSFVLADKLAYCRFLYKEELQPPQYERWTPRWLRQRIPAAIRVEMAPLDPLSGRLPIGNVTAQIHVNRDVFYQYQD